MAGGARTRRSLLVAVAAAAGLAGCSDGGGDFQQPEQHAAGSPTADIRFSFHSDRRVTVSHEGGDDLDVETLTVDVEGKPVYFGQGVPDDRTDADGDGVVAGWDPDDGTAATWDGGDGTVSTGDTLTLEDADGSHVGDTVEVVWHERPEDYASTLSVRSWPGDRE